MYIAAWTLQPGHPQTPLLPCSSDIPCTCPDRSRLIQVQNQRAVARPPEMLSFRAPPLASPHLSPPALYLPPPYRGSLLPLRPFVCQGAVLHFARSCRLTS